MTTTPNTDIFKMQWQSPVGLMVLAATEKGLRGVWFADQHHLPDHAAWQTGDSIPVLRQAVQQLGEYFAQLRKVFDLPLDLQTGTPFQRAVWNALLEIPSGQTATYTHISKSIHKPTAVRAVGGAVGRNPLSIIVPCHRVIGSDGSLTGYAGGLHRKVALLKLEAGS